MKKLVYFIVFCLHIPDNIIVLPCTNKNKTIWARWFWSVLTDSGEIKLPRELNIYLGAYISSKKCWADHFRVLWTSYQHLSKIRSKLLAQLRWAGPGERLSSKRQTNQSKRENYVLWVMPLTCAKVFPANTVYCIFQSLHLTFIFYILPKAQSCICPVTQHP